MPSNSILTGWPRSGSLSLVVHAGILGAFYLGSPLGSVRGTERAGPEPSLRFVPRAAPAEPEPQPEPESLPALELERRVEPTLVQPVPVPPEPLEPLPEDRALARVEFLPRAFERVRPRQLPRRPEPPELVRELPPQPIERAPAPPPTEVLAPERDRAGEEEAAVVLPVPRADACPEPAYPARALRRNQAGTVLCRLTIAADGAVLAVVVERGSGSEELDRAAREALEDWRFEPGTRSGVPCEMDVWKSIVFQLPR